MPRVRGGVRVIAMSLSPFAFGRFTFLSRLGGPRLTLACEFMLCFLLLGAVLVAAAAWVLFAGLTIDFATNQIRYLPTKRYPLVFDYLYAACVTGPLLLHRNIYLRIFGFLILVFFGVSILVFNPARYSVWCFFAAVCSIVLYLFVASRNGLGRRRPALIPDAVPAIDPQKL